MTDVRERLARRIMLAQYPSYRGEPTHGQCDLADAILSDSELVDALVRSRLEQVGWWRGPYQTFNLTHELNPYAPEWRGGECEPLYRIKGET